MNSSTDAYKYYGSIAINDIDTDIPLSAVSFTIKDSINLFGTDKLFEGENYINTYKSARINQNLKLNHKHLLVYYYANEKNPDKINIKRIDKETDKDYDKNLDKYNIYYSKEYSHSLHKYKEISELLMKLFDKYIE